MYKSLIATLSCFAFFISCNQKNNSANNSQKDTVQVVVPENRAEEQSLSEVITKFVRAYSSEDNEKVNSLISKDLGFYIIYRPGASDTFMKTDSLDFSKPIPEYYAYPKFVSEHALVYDKLPIYDCGLEKWDKEGFYCDTTAHPNQLSNIAAFEDEFEEDKFSEEDLLKLEIAEKESYRVIVTNDNPLIFHVRKYKGKWYVVALDRAYAGCDA